MRIAAGPLPGRTYILDDYSVISVLRREGDMVRFRTRGQPRLWRRRCVVERIAPAAILQARLRAEIDGGFFPDVALAGTGAFRHQPDQEAALRHHLADRAAHRPFVA